MLKRIPVLIGCIGIMTTLCSADEALKTQKQKAGYGIGIELGKQLAVSKENFDLDTMVLGIKDMMEGKKSRLSDEEILSVMEKFKEAKWKKERELRQQANEKSKKEAEAYLAANKKKEGVVTLASGLQYKVIKSGNKDVHPKLSDKVITHYVGKLTDGSVFDSSYERGKVAAFPVNAVIKGWIEALQKMKVGDKWELTVPPELAYGKRGAPPKIGPNAVLIFEIELLEIE